MVAKVKIHTTPGEGVKIKAGTGKVQGGGRAKASAARIAAQKKEEKRKAAVDMRSGRIRTKQGLATRLRTAAARTPLAAGYFARSGGGGGSRK